MVYEEVIRPLIFRFSRDPEDAHEAVLSLLHNLGQVEPLAKLVEKHFLVSDKRLEQNLWGLKFRNPVGLAAGFDKNAIAIGGLAALGFGFLEIGTITPLPQEGKPRQRIFRFPKDSALINRMGFNNFGTDAVSAMLCRIKKLSIPLGISLGKGKDTPLEKAVDDYIRVLQKMYLQGDYFVGNLASPNTAGLRELQTKKYFADFVISLQEEAIKLADYNGIKKKPILIKIAPDISDEDLDNLLDVCLEQKIEGIVAVNTTVSREGLSVRTSEEGGMSGTPLWSKAIRTAQYIDHYTNSKLPIIGVGGISGSDQANEMLEIKSVKLLQVLTSLIYKGPSIARNINRGILLKPRKI